MVSSRGSERDGDPTRETALANSWGSAKLAAVYGASTGDPAIVSGAESIVTAAAGIGIFPSEERWLTSGPTAAAWSIFALATEHGSATRRCFDRGGFGGVN